MPYPLDHECNWFPAKLLPLISNHVKVRSSLDGEDGIGTGRTCMFQHIRLTRLPLRYDSIWFGLQVLPLAMMPCKSIENAGSLRPTLQHGIEPRPCKLTACRATITPLQHKYPGRVALPDWPIGQVAYRNCTDILALRERHSSFELKQRVFSIPSKLFGSFPAMTIGTTNLTFSNLIH